MLLWIGAGHAQAEAHRVTVGERGVVADSNSKITFVEPPDARASIVKTDPAHWYIFFDARNASPSLAKITFTEEGQTAAKSVDVQVVKRDVDSTGVAITALTRLLVLAFLLEQAFAALFNWRVFLEFFDSRGVKTPLMVFAAWLVVSTFDLDIFTDLVNAYSTSTRSVANSGSMQFLTAMILAGGSKAVNAVMVNLGMRDNRPPEAVQPKPAKDKAWFAVVVNPMSTGNLRAVYYYTPPVPAAGAAAGGQPAQAMLLASGVMFSIGDRFRKYFFRRSNRFPMSGGYVVDAEKGYLIELRGFDKDGNPLALDPYGETFDAKTAKPFYFAQGAIVDFKVNFEPKV